MRWCWVLIISIAFHAGGIPAYAQQSVDVGSVSGRVTDTSGAVVPGATVTARQTETNLVSTTTTDTAGRFRLPYLRIGPYEVTVRHAGFQDAVQPLTIAAGSAFELPVTLSIAGVAATVSVTAGDAVLEAARSQIASTISMTEVRALPMNGRNFLELALLVPGVSPTNTASTQLFPETSAVPGVSLSVASQRNLSNNFVVDGVSASDDAAGLSGMTFGVDAVEQFQVVTSGAQAELGRALGGYINVVTRSGTNELHGTAYGYLRDDALNASHPLLRARLPMQQRQYGASLGGPIVANRAFYFANVERRTLDQTGLTTITAANAAAINERLDAVGYAGPRVRTGIYDNPVRTANVLGKLDHRVSDAAHLSARYSGYDARGENTRGAGGLSAPSASSRLENADHSLAVGYTVVLSARTVWETRGQIAHGDLAAPATDPVGPAVSIAGVASFGRSSSSPTSRVNTLYQFVNNVSHQAGAHAVRFGVDLLYNSSRIEFPRAARGAYTFSSLANFLAGVYNTAGFAQTFGVTEVTQTNPNAGVYVQDEWKAGADLTLNLGVRYDLQFLETIDTDTDNVAPRAGFAWSPFASRRTIVRGSAGIFYDRVPLRALANALLSAGNTTDAANLRQINVTLSPGQAGAPVFPAVLPELVPSLSLVNLTTMDRRLQNANSRQASVEVEQQVGRTATLAVSYHYLRGRQLLMSINQNVPTCAASGTNNGCRPNPDYANNNQYSAAGSSNYHGLHVSFTQRPARWGHYRVSYTLSNSMNNVGEFFFSSPIDPADLAKDWGRSDNDQRHRLVVSGSIQTPMAPASGLLEMLTHGFNLSAMAQWYSALPFNITSGVTTVQGTAGRPIVNGEFIERNAGSGTAFFSLNARVSRTLPLRDRVQLELLIEGFNLTNHHNVVARNGTFGSGAYPSQPLPSFGQITAVGDPRSGQVAVRLKF